MNLVHVVILRDEPLTIHLVNYTRAAEPAKRLWLIKGKRRSVWSSPRASLKHANFSALQLQQAHLHFSHARRVEYSKCGILITWMRRSYVIYARLLLWYNFCTLFEGSCLFRSTLSTVSKYIRVGASTWEQSQTLRQCKRAYFCVCLCSSIWKFTQMALLKVRDSSAALRPELWRYFSNIFFIFPICFSFSCFSLILQSQSEFCTGSFQSMATRRKNKENSCLPATNTFWFAMRCSVIIKSHTHNDSVFAPATF